MPKIQPFLFAWRLGRVPRKRKTGESIREKGKQFRKLSDFHTGLYQMREVERLVYILREVMNERKQFVYPP